VMPGGTSQTITPKFAEYSSVMSSYSGGKARAYGSNTASPANAFAPTGDGEDFFIVNMLQSMVVNQETIAGVESADTLTLDGQAGTDTYVVNPTGTHGPNGDDGDKRNYLINVLDSGKADDGVDNLSIYGRDDTSVSSPYRGSTGGFDDIFL